MKSVLYHRIKWLCSQKGVPISKLESDLGFGNSSIKKWERVSSPSVNKVIAIANYFGVSVDYLLGRTDISSSVSDVIGDDDLISLQRARQNMIPSDRDKMMQMVKLGFEYAFKENDDSK